MTGPLPLDRVRVLDLTKNVAGPFATMILADLGADVVKIEPPGTGDDARQWGPPFWGGETPTFLALNRNKRSVVLDLRAAASRPVLDRLAGRADVIVESGRPGAMERLGYGYAWAAARNPAVVYCSITPFGETGPLRDLPGYDPLMQAYGGLMSVTGEAGRPPVRAGTSLVDMGTGLWAAIAIMGALAGRRDGGGGCHVVTSLYETALMWMAYHLASYWASGALPRRVGSGTPMIAPYEAFATRDGYLVVAAGNDRLFAGLCQTLGHPEWTADERFRRNADRVQHRDALHALIEACTCSRDTRELAGALRAAGLPVSPILSTAEVAADPQAHALGIFQQIAHPTIPDFRSVGLPFLLAGARPPLRRHPPRLGEHTRDALREWGVPPEAIDAVLAEAAAGIPAARPAAGGAPPAGG
jgi:crotonobetainyl-CoA:carnitine CoA-transferase CaiB-like acyl-CoA transferase